MIKRISLSVLAMTMTACGAATVDLPEAGEATNPGIEVRAEPIAAVVPVHGSVEARRRSTLATRMMARVSGIRVEVGDRVRGGETLVRLGTDDVAAKRAMAEAGVVSARAARNEAERHAARMDTLLAEDAVARVQRDQARLALTQAESGLAMAEAVLQEVDTAERYASIRAPFDGYVVSRHIDEGDLSVPGKPLLVVEAEGFRVAVLAVPADLARTLQVGSSIQVISPEGERAHASVNAVASGADPRSRTVEVRADLPSDWSTGIAVTALIPAGVRNVVTISQAAVVRRGQLTGVRVVTPDGELLRWVRLGRAVTPVQATDESGDLRVEVLSGLTPGERIIP